MTERPDQPCIQEELNLFVSEPKWTEHVCHINIVVRYLYCKTTMHGSYGYFELNIEDLKFFKSKFKITRFNCKTFNYSMLSCIEDRMHKIIHSDI